MIRQATTDEDLRKVADMARPIWHEAFAGIITDEQIGYMVERFQSYQAVKDQVDNNKYTYFILSDGGEDAGYCGVQPQEDGTLYLSKIYLKKEFRGRGLFTEMTSFLVEMCRSNSLSAIWLTVNKHNARAIAAYEKNGYRNIRSQTTDIGGGFVMDDYVYQFIIHNS